MECQPVQDDATKGSCDLKLLWCGYYLSHILQCILLKKNQKNHFQLNKSYLFTFLHLSVIEEVS